MQHCIRASLPYKNRTRIQNKDTEKKTQIETGEQPEC